MRYDDGVFTNDPRASNTVCRQRRFEAINLILSSRHNQKIIYFECQLVFRKFAPVKSLMFVIPEAPKLKIILAVL